MSVLTAAVVVLSRPPRKYRPDKRLDDVSESHSCFRKNLTKLPLWIEKLNIHCSVQCCCWNHLST